MSDARNDGTRDEGYTPRPDDQPTTPLDPSPPAPPAPPAYGQEQPPAYGQEQPPAYGQPASYGQQPAYGQPAYGQEQPAYGQYGTPPAYGQQQNAPQSYGQAPSYAASAYGAAPAYGAYAATPKTNGLAIVSLVSSLVGIFIIPFIGSIVGIITGHMALGQIKRTGENGRGLALAGTIVGYVGIAFAILGIILFFAWVSWFTANAGTFQTS